MLRFGVLRFGVLRFGVLRFGEDGVEQAGEQLVSASPQLGHPATALT
ncbi:hypothetical protein ACFYST_17075 [Kitasatospora sp. NPDC004614]